MAGRTRAEQETLIRWDAEDPRVVLYTASPVVAAKWTRLGYVLTPFGDPASPSGWGCTAPKGSVTVRRAHRVARTPPVGRRFTARGDAGTTG